MKKPRLSVYLILSLTWIVPVDLVAQDTSQSYLIYDKTWGMDDVRVSARNVIAEKWHIRFGFNGGCVVHDSITEHNEAEYIRLEAAYGQGWSKKFYNEIDKEEQVQKEVLALYFHQRGSLGGLPDIRGYSFNKMNPISDSIYYIRTLGSEGKRDTAYQYYLISVNIRSKKIEVLSDKREIYYPPQDGRKD